MEEQKKKMTDEQLSQELQKSKGGRAGGKLLSLLGGAVIVVGIILGGNMALIIAGAVLLGLGQMSQGKARDKAGQQTFDTIALDILNTVFDEVERNSTLHLLNAEDTNIPLPSHNYCSGSGYIRGSYHGLTAELCTVKLTDVNEFQREETGLWEKNERETGYKIYRKQGDQEYSLLKNIESGDTLRYADTGLMFDTLYEYKICAVEKLDGEELLGEESDSVAQRTTLESAKMSSVDSLDYQTLQVS